MKYKTTCYYYRNAPPPLHPGASSPLGICSLSKVHSQQVEATAGEGGGRGEGEGMLSCAGCLRFQAGKRAPQPAALPGSTWRKAVRAGEAVLQAPVMASHPLLSRLPISKAAPAICLPSPKSIKEVFPGP